MKSKSNSKYNQLDDVVLHYKKDTVFVASISKISICTKKGDTNQDDWECLKFVECKDTLQTSSYLYPTDSRYYFPNFEYFDLRFMNWIKVGKYCSYLFYNEYSIRDSSNICVKHRHYIYTYENNQLIQSKSYYRNDSIEEISNYNSNILEGKYVYYYKNGLIAEEGDYMNISNITSKIRDQYLAEQEKEDRYIKILLGDFQKYEDIDEWGFGEVEAIKHVKDGKWYYYDKSGKFKGYIQYENGKIINVSLP